MDCALLNLTVVDLFLSFSCLRANGHGQEDDVLGHLMSASSLGEQGKIEQAEMQRTQSCAERTA